MTEQPVLDDFDPSSLAEIMQFSNDITNGGLGAGLMLVVFMVSFYRLSPAGAVPAFTASSFTATILSFLLASTGLMAVEIPFLIATISLGSLGYMYARSRF